MFVPAPASGLPEASAISGNRSVPSTSPSAEPMYPATNEPTNARRSAPTLGTLVFYEHKLFTPPVTKPERTSLCSLHTKWNHRSPPGRHSGSSPPARAFAVRARMKSRSESRFK